MFNSSFRFGSKIFSKRNTRPLENFLRFSKPKINSSHLRAFTLATAFTSSYFVSQSILNKNNWIDIAYAEASKDSDKKDNESPSLPYFKREEIKKHNAYPSIWVTFKGDVYDITNFIDNHPGGKDKILMAAGGDIEAFWAVYRQHYNSPLPAKWLSEMKIGHVDPAEYEAELKEKEKNKSNSDENNPYSKDPTLSPLLSYLSRQPINAESPSVLLADNFITPEGLFFVRNHHPVPHISPQNHILTFFKQNSNNNNTNNNNNKEKVDPLKSYSKTSELSLMDLLNKFPSKEVISSIQCGGNRRADMTKVEVTNGASWQVGAMSTAKWTGVGLSDVIKGLYPDITDIQTAEAKGFKHVHFVGADGMEASIPIRKALDPDGEVILATKMNDQPLPEQHGFPLRAVIPGHAGVRNVKWVKDIRLSTEEAYGTWQRGMAYKGFGPSVKNLNGIDVEAIPSLQEQPVQSAILSPSPTSTVLAPGDNLRLSGFAYSGGGRGIVRVDVSIDGGKNWVDAQLNEGSDQRLDKAWAWTLWEANFNVPENADKVEAICKATDASYNVQPDTVKGIWNLRGINNNAWHRVTYHTKKTS